MASKRPTKQDVFDAFYEGVCCVLASANVLGSISLNALEVDKDEFREWLSAHPEHDEILAWMGD